MKQLFTLTILCSSVVAFAQPELESWMYNTTGAGTTYEYYQGNPQQGTTQVTLNDSSDVLGVCYNNNYIYVRTNGLPSYHMGPWLMNPNEPAAQYDIYRFPRNPQPAANPEAQPFAGPLGLAVNGVALYGTGDARSYNSSTNTNSGNGDGLWNGDAWASEGETMDPGGAGHADGQENYHYHATPIALYDGTGATHSPIIGWAFDGYPIYGPFGYTNPTDASSPIKRIESGYALRSITDRTTLPDGSTSVPAGPSDFNTFPLGTYWEDYEFTGNGDLDVHNGRFCYTPEYPQGTYAYFVTMDSNGEPAYPYMVGPEYYGDMSNSDSGPQAGGETIPVNGSCFDPLSVGVEEMQEVEIAVYPNPCITDLTIPGLQNRATYQVFDLLGAKVSEGTTTGTVSVDALHSGNYILVVKTEDATVRSRFVKL